jgi:hypothetical protein
MRIRRLTIGGLGAFAALSLAVAGCTQPPGGAASTPSASAPSPEAGTTADATTPAAQGEALAELTAAAQKLNDDTVTVDLRSSGLTSQASLDPKGDKATMSMKITAQNATSTVEVRALENDFYLRATGMPNVDPTTWMHVDGARLAGTAFDPLPDGDAAGANRFISGMTQVQRDGSGYRGTLDLTKVPGSGGVSVDVLGEKGKAVPFTATVDTQGRLTSLTLDLSTVDPQLGTLASTYSGFGEPVTVAAPPAAQQVEPPESVLKLFGAK